MSGDDHITPPPVIWAQRSNVILLTICLEDCTKPEIKIYNDKVFFKGIGGSDKKTHEVTINLYKEIDPEKSLHCVRDRNIEFILRKKDDGPFWPHLTKEKMKYHWLKVDFNKWKDEDDSDDTDGEMGYPRDDALEEMMRGMGGLGGGGAGDNKLNLDDLDINEGADSDDDDLPDLE